MIMKNNEKIYEFLKSNGFELTQRDISVFFGDYCDIFSNDFFQLKLCSVKSFETVDIRSNQINEGWYDLALVKDLLYNEKNLNQVTTIEEFRDFLQKELSNIIELFNDRNYSTTKKRLEKLGNKRAEQMFPGIRK
jgi:hypothetical protein